MSKKMQNPFKDKMFYIWVALAVVFGLVVLIGWLTR